MTFKLPRVYYLSVISLPENIFLFLIAFVFSTLLCQEGSSCSPADATNYTSYKPYIL